MEDYNKWRIEQGLPIYGPKREKHLRSFRCSDLAYNGLIELAGTLGYMFTSSGRTNLNDLLEALGTHMLYVEPIDSEDAPEHLNIPTAYEDGKMDAKEGRQANPSLIYGPNCHRRIREAYLAGYHQNKEN